MGPQFVLPGGKGSPPETVALWGKVTTAEDRTWTERYLAGEAFGAGSWSN